MFTSSARNSSVSMLVENPSATTLPIARLSAAVHGSGSIRSSRSSNAERRSGPDRRVHAGRIRLEVAAAGGRDRGHLGVRDPLEAERAHHAVGLQSLGARELG